MPNVITTNIATQENEYSNRLFDLKVKNNFPIESNELGMKLENFNYTYYIYPSRVHSPDCLIRIYQSHFHYFVS